MREQTMTQHDAQEWAAEMAESLDTLLRSIDTWPRSQARAVREILDARPDDTPLPCPRDALLVRAWELGFRRRELGKPASPGVAALTRAILAADETVLVQ